MRDHHVRWRQRRYVASVWKCDDPFCDCSQPQIELVAPNLAAGPPWLRRETVWSGTFETNGEGDADVWRAELAAAAPRFGITLDESGLYGEAPASMSPTSEAA